MKKYLPLTGLLIVGISVLSCTAPDTRDIEAKPFVLETKKNCFSHRGHSVELDEIKETATIYRNTTCTPPSSREFELSMNPQYKGAWNNYFLFDEGTDVNSRTFRLVPLLPQQRPVVLNYEDESPKIFEKTIVYYEPTHEMAPRELCKQLGIEVDAFERQEDWPFGLAHKAIFYADTAAIVKHNSENRCYFIQ